MNSSKLVISDICNTLFDSNTTFDFIRFCINENKIRKKRISYVISTSRLSPLFWLFVIYQKFSKKDLIKQKAVLLFKGCKEEELNLWAEEFYEQFLTNHLMHQIWDIFKSYPDNMQFLASSTLSPIANVIAKKNGVPFYVASEMEIDKGIYTGRISNDITGKKAAAIRHLTGSGHLNILAMITDNSSDKELMLMAENKFAVCYSRMQEKFWNKIPGTRIIKGCKY